MSDTPAPEQASNPGHAVPRVLIVDPTEMGGLLQALLQRHRIDAQLCRTAAAALDEILAAPPALAIIDLDLPDASGVDLLHILRQPPENVPVVFTGSAPKEALAQNVQRGVEAAQGFFQKPLHARLLLDHVTQLLGLARLPTVTPPSGVPIPSAEDVGQFQAGRDPFHPARAGAGPESLGIPSLAPMEGVQPSLPPAGHGDEEHLGVEHLEILEEDVVLVESDLPEPAQAASPAVPPPLPPDALRISSTTMPTLPPMPPMAPGMDPNTLPPALEGGPTLPDMQAPQFSTPALPVIAPPPLDAQPDPTDLMAMWMRKRAAQSTAKLPVMQAAPPPLSGTLLERPLHALLDAFYSTQESGSLVLQRGAAQRKLGMVKGAVGPCTSNVAGEQAVAVLQALKLVPPDVLEQARRDSGGKDVLGRLVTQGALTRARAVEVLEEQRSRILKAAFAARDATYTLAFGPPPRSALPPRAVGAVILGGLLGALTLLELRQQLPRNRVYVPHTGGHYPMESLALTAEQARLVIACDGTKTVEDLLALSDLAEHEVLGVLHALEALRLIRAVAQAPQRVRGPTFF